MTPKKQITIEQLARMVKRGFDQAVTKDDLRNFATKDDLRDFRKDMTESFDHINVEIRDIKIVLGPLVRMVAVQEADMRNLRMRVDRLERKAGFAR